MYERTKTLTEKYKSNYFILKISGYFEITFDFNFLLKLPNCCRNILTKFKWRASRSPANSKLKIKLNSSKLDIFFAEKSPLQPLAETFLNSL